MPMRKKTKIAYVIGSLATGGAERQLLELLKHLDRSRFDASLVLFDAKTASRAEALVSQVFSLDIPATDNARPSVQRAMLISSAWLRMAGHFKQLRPEIVHAILPMACVLAGPAAKAAGVPIVIGSRRSLPSQYRSDDRLPAAVERFSMRFLDQMLGNSAAVTRTIVNDDRYPGQRVDTIYNGVDTVRFNRSNSRHWREAMGWRPEHVVFGTVANFFSYKCHTDVVEAAAAMRTPFPQARFVLVGQDRGSMPMVRARIAELKLEDVITIVPGTGTPEDVFAAMDVYICPSATEGFSNVLLEAMASGKPVIATDVGGNPELIHNRKNGFIVPVKSPSSIVEAAASFLADAALIASAGAESRALVEQNFSVTRMVERYHQLYSDLLDENSERRRRSFFVPFRER